MTAEELMLKNVMRESRLEDAKAKAAAKAKVEAEAAAKAKAEAEARDGVDEIANLFGTSGGGGGGSSSSSGLEVDEELLAMTIGDLEMEIARRQSFIEEEEKNGNGEAEEVETARQEAIRFAIALDVKKARDAGGDWEMGDEDEALFGEAASAFENGEGMDVDTSAGEDPEPEPALTDEGGEFVSEDAEIQMAVDLLSLDLSPEAFERQQEEMMQAMIAQHERTLEINAAERAARVQEEARKQEEREAQYRQEGEYDRDKDIRNDVDGFIAAGMPIPTPSVLDGFAGRPGGENYTSKKKIQQLTFGQVQSSANFRRNPSKFIKQWQELQREWRMEVAAKVAKHVDADRKKAESRKKREDAAKVRAAETAKEEKRLQEVRADRGREQGAPDREANEERTEPGTEGPGAGDRQEHAQQGQDEVDLQEGWQACGGCDQNGRFQEAEAADGQVPQVRCHPRGREGAARIYLRGHQAGVPPEAQVPPVRPGRPRGRTPAARVEVRGLGRVRLLVPERAARESTPKSRIG